MLSAAASTVVVDELSRPTEEEGPRGERGSLVVVVVTAVAAAAAAAARRSVQLRLGSVAAERRSRQQH